MMGRSRSPTSRDWARHCWPRLALAATAESCTGGGLAAAITDTAGSSAWFDRGFVTYTNEAKQQMLGVSIDSPVAPRRRQRTVVLKMTRGCLARSGCGYLRGHQRYRRACRVAARRKPVGTVWFAGQIVPVVTSLLARFRWGSPSGAPTKRSDEPCRTRCSLLK